eukprot:755278-Hanusia_phi.AAC.5
MEIVYTTHASVWRRLLARHKRHAHGLICCWGRGARLYHIGEGIHMYGKICAEEIAKSFNARLQSKVLETKVEATLSLTCESW